MEYTTTSKEAALRTCYHCGDVCTGSHYLQNDKVFCCAGCQTVYGLLNKNGLCDYYAMSDRPGIKQVQPQRKGKYDFLDDDRVRKSLVQFSNSAETHVSFYIPQIHCSGCLWLLEHLQRLNPGVIRSQVNATCAAMV
jgi:P-type Cu+ transporter